MKSRVLVSLLVTGLVPIVVVAYLALRQAEAALMKQAFDHLESVREVKRSQLESFFHERASDIVVLSRSSDVLAVSDALNSFHEAADAGPQAPFRVGSIQYQELIESAAPFLSGYRQVYGYYDLFILCREHGHVMYSVAAEADLGANLSSGDLRDSGLGRLWREVADVGETVFVDFAPYAPSDNEPAAFIGAPTADGSAIVVLQVSRDHINSFMQQRAGMGLSGESYLVGTDLLMRSDSFLDPIGHSMVASFRGTVAANGVDTEASRRARLGETSQALITDYNGHPVLSSFGPIDVLGTRWAIIAEIDLAEVQQPVDQLRSRLLLVTCAVAGVVMGLAIWLAGSIAGPIVRIAHVAQRVARGDVEQRLDIESQDEIGQLAASFRDLVDYTSDMAASARDLAAGDLTITATPRSDEDVLAKSFAAMADRLRHAFVGLRNQAATLRKTSGDMSSMAEAVASDAGEVSNSATAVSAAAEQVSTNMSTLSAAATQSQENISTMAASTEEMTATISEISRNASDARQVAEQAVSAVTTASQRMQDLHENAKQIGEVIDVIVDIADQTKLLALNATIEAASAGDAGKGFAVVAGEVKELARQTADATGRIRASIEASQMSTQAAMDEIQRIEQVMGTVDESVSGIAVAVEEQSVTTRDIAVNINQAAQGMGAVTDNVAQMATASTDIARQITSVKDASGSLRSEVDRARVQASELSKLGQEVEHLVAQYRLEANEEDGEIT
ncbi:MAG: HAMP domain-containing protein [Gemmatimonadetes bacterium]|nr:HAMP domain-containing protein [Gemmatimonadota bacterium]